MIRSQIALPSMSPLASSDRHAWRPRSPGSRRARASTCWRRDRYRWARSWAAVSRKPIALGQIPPVGHGGCTHRDIHRQGRFAGRQHLARRLPPLSQFIRPQIYFFQLGHSGFFRKEFQTGTADLIISQIQLFPQMTRILGNSSVSCALMSFGIRIIVNIARKIHANNYWIVSFFILEVFWLTRL